MSSIERICLGTIYVDNVDRHLALATIRDFLYDERPRLVLTPNIAHVYQATRESAVQAAYERADLATPDGWPLVSALKLMRDDRSVPLERVTGADLTPEVLALDARIALVGGRDDTAEVVASMLRIQRADPKLLVEPVPPGELSDAASREALLDRVAGWSPDIILLALGVPKQEALALDLLDRLDRGVVMCIGASLDFMAGRVERAPLILQRARLEWLHRVVTDPKRLLARYGVAAPHFSGVLLRAWWDRNQRKRKRS